MTNQTEAVCACGHTLAQHGEGHEPTCLWETCSCDRFERYESSPAVPEAQPQAETTFHELFERSKDDRAFITGSEVRQVIGAYRRLEQQLKTVLDRESASQKRHDAKLDELEQQLANARKEALGAVDIVTVRHESWIKSKWPVIANAVGQVDLIQGAFHEGFTRGYKTAIRALKSTLKEEM